MSNAAEEVVAQFNEIVKPDGGSVIFVSATQGVLTVRYAPGKNEECETCVMEPHALAGMMRDMVVTLDPSITDVQIEAASS